MAAYVLCLLNANGGGQGQQMVSLPGKLPRPIKGEGCMPMFYGHRMGPVRNVAQATAVRARDGIRHFRALGKMLKCYDDP